MRLIWFRNFVHRSTFVKGGKKLRNRWTTALSAAPTGVQASTTPKMKAERDQPSETLCSGRNVTHKITEVTNHTTFNIPQIFVTIYVPQQTNLLGKFNGSPHHSPRINRHKSTRWNDTMQIMKLLFPSFSSLHPTRNPKRFVPRHWNINIDNYIDPSF